MGTHTISNSSTLRGWLESMGLDDIIMNPCSCIFGEEQEPPPLPGQRRYQGGRGYNGNQRSGSVRANGKRGLNRQQSMMEVKEEPQNPLSSFFGFG